MLLTSKNTNFLHGFLVLLLTKNKVNCCLFLLILTSWSILKSTIRQEVKFSLWLIQAVVFHGVNNRYVNVSNIAVYIFVFNVNCHLDLFLLIKCFNISNLLVVWCRRYKV